MTDLPTMTDVPAPPYEDDDEEPAFEPRPRRRAHVLTYVLAGAALVAAGFLGGVLVQKHQDRGSTNTAAAAPAASRFAAGGATTGSGAAAGTGGRANGNGFGAGGGFGGNGIAGTVKLVDGNNIYVTDTSGNIVKVKTTKNSQVNRTVGATTKDLAPGDAVIVRGTQNPDGSYAATTVVDSTPNPSN